MLTTNQELKRLIDDLWNKLWSGGISNPLTAIEQITYLIFIRKLDENESLFQGIYPEIKDIEKERFKKGEEDKEKRVPKSELRWRNFSKLEDKNEKLTLFRDFVFPFIKELNGEHSRFTHAMHDAVFVISNAPVLEDAIKTIDALYVEIEKDAKEHSFQDIQGDVYEMLLNQLSQAGKNGQFRTPRHIIELVAKLVDPKKGDKIGDPACGTGGFLLGAYQHITKNGKIEVENPKLYGYDIDVTMVRLGLMNLIMHGIDDPQIENMDTLSKEFNQEENSTYDVILANPPFTGSLNKEEIDETLLLKKDNNSTKTELLFIERMHKMLKKGGTAGIIIPQGVLFGAGKAFVKARKIMIEDSQLKAVISMPSGVFQPYAGVTTAILIFTKGSTTKDVFFYNMENDGYSLDVKRTKIEQSDIEDIIKKYKDKKFKGDKAKKAFFVSRKEIEKNDFDLSFNTYYEEEYAPINYREPNLILEELQILEDDIQSDLKEIKSLF
jgi:type I restriction enzyme M protein